MVTKMFFHTNISRGVFARVDKLRIKEPEGLVGEKIVAIQEGGYDFMLAFESGQWATIESDYNDGEGTEVSMTKYETGQIYLDDLIAVAIITREEEVAIELATHESRKERQAARDAENKIKLRKLMAQFPEEVQAALSELAPASETEIASDAK